MSANSRMTIAVHIPSFMVLWEQRRREPATSEDIAESVKTNPVVIRRMLGLLQKAVLVKGRRGANAGWTFARRSDAITLLDVYNAVENAPLFGMHASLPSRTCPVGRGIQPALTKVYGSLEKQLRERLAKTRVSQVFAETVG